MELFRNIFFNTDKLVENNLVKISYTGDLFQNNAEKVFLHFGFGNEWKNLKDVEMTKTELGFQAEIKLVSNENLNLVFRDDNNNWDNNENKNYSFEIDEAPKALAVYEEQTLSYPRKLKKSYIFAKKLKVRFYKFFKYLNRIILGDYSTSMQEN